MNRQSTQVIFFAGTDTDVGKTYTAALTAKLFHHSGVTVGVYKPVASGCRQEETDLIADDALSLWQAAGKPRSLDDVCPQKFLAPLAPTTAASKEDKTVDKQLLRGGADVWLDSCEALIVEGAGGLMSPLAEGVLNIDLFRTFKNASLIIVAANRLGVIHQTLATCAAARQHGVQPAGIILSNCSTNNDESVRTNANEIAKYTDVPLLGEVLFKQNAMQADWMDRFKLNNR